MLINKTHDRTIDGTHNQTTEVVCVYLFGFMVYTSTRTYPTYL